MRFCVTCNYGGDDFFCPFCGKVCSIMSAEEKAVENKGWGGHDILWEGRDEKENEENETET